RLLAQWVLPSCPTAFCSVTAAPDTSDPSTITKFDVIDVVAC
ncbi:MAG: hypothetical protein QOD04_2317, partial [Pseudonocardiales bacterium]|nr:hypothetical protein [Pseudonocardiales bacterium]